MLQAENTQFCGLFNIAKGRRGRALQGVPRLLAEVLACRA